MGFRHDEIVPRMLVDPGVIAALSSQDTLQGVFHMGRTLAIVAYLIVLSGFIEVATADAPSTPQPTPPPAALPPPVSPPAGVNNGQPGVYWTPRQQQPQS